MKTLFLTLAMLMVGSAYAVPPPSPLPTANQSCYDETYYAPVNRGPVAVVCDNGEWGLSSKPIGDEGKSW